MLCDDGGGEKIMRTATIVGTVTLLLALCAIPCVAQDGYRQDNTPRGDYAETCRNIHMEGDRLVAECQRRDGGWRRSSLEDASRCRGEIHNIDGSLTCSGGDQGDRHDGRRDWRNGLPPGNYVETCRNIRMEGDRLEAECRERDGDWRRSSINDVDRCNGPVVNDNGNLSCSQGGTVYGDHNGYRLGSHDGVPSGPYAQSCRNIRANGYALAAECQKRDGGWRNTSLYNFDQCTGAIGNDDGHLVCSKDGSGGSGDGYGNGYGRGNGDRYRFGWHNGLPSGGYVQSCRNIRAKGYALAAECQKRNGGWRNTSLYNFDQCTSAIANDDGHLVCPK